MDSKTIAFIEKARKIHGDKYDYSKIEYKNTSAKICIICPKHGEFWQEPSHHLSGNNCPKCAHQSYKDTTESFTEKARKVHGDKYDYSKVEYVNAHTKVCITCPKHGDFWMLPTNHLSGKGCKICKESKHERYIRKLLKEHNIEFVIGKKFEWLGKQHLDFYLPDYNVAIECQGGQHLFEDKSSVFFGTLKHVIERDEKKNKLCNENGVRLLYYIENSILKRTDKLPSIYNGNYYTSGDEIIQQIKNA